LLFQSLKALLQAKKAHHEMSSHLQAEVSVLHPGVFLSLVNMTAAEALTE
jgi:hypothetical protein